MGVSQSKQNIISNNSVKCTADSDPQNMSTDAHSTCMEAGSCKANTNTLFDEAIVNIKIEDTGYVKLDSLVKKASCCLNRDKLYDLFVTVERNSSITYSYYMRACCYVKITGDFAFSKSFKCRGLFPFNIGVIDVVRLNSDKEVFAAVSRNYRVFELVNESGEITSVKFAKVPYVGSAYL